MTRLGLSSLSTAIAAIPALLILHVDRTAGFGSEICSVAFFDLLDGCHYAATGMLMEMTLILAVCWFVFGGLAVSFLRLANGPTPGLGMDVLGHGVLFFASPFAAFGAAMANAWVAPTAGLCAAPFDGAPGCDVRAGPYLWLLAGLLMAAAFLPLPRRRGRSIS